MSWVVLLLESRMHKDIAFVLKEPEQPFSKR